MAAVRMRQCYLNHILRTHRFSQSIQIQESGRLPENNHKDCLSPSVSMAYFFQLF